MDKNVIKIIGNTTATPTPRSDWNQADEAKADFILNKPALGSIAEKDVIEKNDLASDVQTSLGKADVALDSAKTYTNITVSSHNTSTSSHNDIRDLISGLTTRLNALANSDDTTLDQMAEVVSYIKANRDLISQVTTNKVNVADIIDNLTTNVAEKPLSAAQGVALKTLIDTLSDELDTHGHAIADVSGLQAALDGKAASSHGTHVNYSSTAPVMDGTASAGSAETVARSDHKHPTDTSRASQADLNALKDTVNGKVPSTRKVNGKALSGDITLNAGDVGAASKTDFDVLEDSVDSIVRVPAVTTSDNGKFLRVVSGVWAAASIPNAEEAEF